MDQQTGLVTQVLQDNRHLVQILASGGTVMATVGAPKQQLQTRFPCFCIWQGEGELSVDVPPVVLCVVLAAGSVAGGKDDEDGAWLGAVNEAKNLVLNMLTREAG